MDRSCAQSYGEAAVRQRSQVQNPQTGIWTERSTVNGRFMDGKADGTPFKGVTREE